MRRLRRHAIHFAAIARGEHQCLLENPSRPKLLSGTLGLLGVERHPLAHLHRRRAMI